MTTRREILSVWKKSLPIRGANSGSYRKDAYGNTIRFASYGTHGEYGWQVDHKNPLANGGSESMRNKQPLHWKENLSKGSKYPYKRKRCTN